MVGCSLEGLDLGESERTLGEGPGGFSDHVLAGHDGRLDHLDGFMGCSVLSLHVLVYIATGYHGGKSTYTSEK